MLDSVKQFWLKLSPPMRIGGSLAVAAVFFSLVFFALFSAPDYQPLFTDLNPDDAAAIVTVLRDSGISYRIDDNGSTVLVSPDQVYETRLTLASQGLPRGGIVGFEIFTTTRLGETEADRQLRYLWALQGELTRTIRELQEVQDARVHIVLPRRSLFVQESQPSTASVLLTLTPGVRLSSQQIRGIAHLVATSVEGLTPGNITIVDSRGNVLSDPDTDMSLDGQGIAQRLALEQSYERQLEASVTAMLERIYGYGKVVTRVSVALDFDVQEQISELFEAPTRDGGLIRSQQTYDESHSGTGGVPGGIPGVETNIPGYVGPVAGGESEYSRQETITNYELNRIERRHSQTPGQIQNLSVSVWIDGELAQAELTAVEESVRTALGMRLERGDEIFVSSMAFAPDFLAVTADMIEDAMPFLPWWWLTIAVGLVLTGVLLVWRRRRMQQAEELAQVDLVVGDDEEPEPQEELSPEERERLDLRKRIEELAKEQPGQFAQLMKMWLTEE